MRTVSLARRVAACAVIVLAALVMEVRPAFAQG